MTRIWPQRWRRRVAMRWYAPAVALAAGATALAFPAGATPPAMGATSRRCTRCGESRWMFPRGSSPR
jgi:hypothetical protein